MGRGAWRAPGYEVTKSQTGLSDSQFHCNTWTVSPGAAFHCMKLHSLCSGLGLFIKKYRCFVTHRPGHGALETFRRSACTCDWSSRPLFLLNPRCAAPGKCLPPNVSLRARPLPASLHSDYSPIRFRLSSKSPSGPQPYSGLCS